MKDKEKKSCFKFQKMSEIATVAGAEENADDKILLYCLYLKVYFFMNFIFSMYIIVLTWTASFYDILIDNK